MKNLCINVYKIWWEDEPDEFYVGSTKKTYLSARMSKHRTDCRKGGMSKLYVKMREKGSNSFQYVLLGWSMVSSFDEQRMVEQSYISRLNPTLNSCRAHTTEDERKSQQKERDAINYQENKDEILRKCKIYHQENKERQNQVSKNYHEAHKESINQRSLANYHRDRERLNQKSKEYQRLHRDTIKVREKAYLEQKKDNRVCICGGTYDYGITSKRKRHYATPKHTQFLNALYEKLRG